MTVVIYSGLLLVALAWGWIDGGRSIWVHPEHGASVEPAVEHLRRHGLWGALAGVGIGLAVVAASRAVTALSDWGKRLHMEFRQVIQGLSTWDAFVIALFSAVGEEALFRGALQPNAGLWISAAVFGLVHFPVRRGLWPWPVLAFGMGLAFGVLYREGGDLGGPILAHMTINFFNLRHIARVRFPDHVPPEDRQPAAGAGGAGGAGGVEGAGGVGGEGGEEAAGTGKGAAGAAAGEPPAERRERGRMDERERMVEREPPTR
jgi:hypothetical protein